MACDKAEAADAVRACVLSDNRAETLDIEFSVDGSPRALECLASNCRKCSLVLIGLVGLAWTLSSHDVPSFPEG